MRSSVPPAIWFVTGPPRRTSCHTTQTQSVTATYICRCFVSLWSTPHVNTTLFQPSQVVHCLTQLDGNNYNILTNSVCYSAASIGTRNTWHSNIIQHHCHESLTHQLSACQSCDIQCAVADSNPVDCYRWLSELFVLANGQESGTCAA